LTCKEQSKEMKLIYCRSLQKFFISCK